MVLALAERLLAIEQIEPSCHLGIEALPDRPARHRTNWLSSVMRNVFTGAAIYSAHIGEEIADYPVGTRAGDRAHWYAMQLATTKNFDVPLAISLLIGGLDRSDRASLVPEAPAEPVARDHPRRAFCMRATRHALPVD